MTINEYQEKALKTESKNGNSRIMHGLMGVVTEVGEAMDIMKDYQFYGVEFDSRHMAKEIGDIAWYVALLADAIGYKLEDILQMNIDKLNERYHNQGFNVEDALHRDKNDI